MLSLERRAHLATLLPPTAFYDYQPSLERFHPSEVASETNPLSASTSHAQTSSSFSPDALDISVFTDPHFLAAAHTFQDQLYSGALSDATAKQVKMFEGGIQDGSLHAPWKDEVWLRNNPPPSNDTDEAMACPESAARAGCVISFFFDRCVHAKCPETLLS
jgi:hypothetical protein